MSERRSADLDRQVYGLVDAARILGLPTAKVRNWLDGYERDGKTYEPVIRPERSGVELVTWGEFVELGYLREYRKAKVPLQRVRPVIVALREELGTVYPLAHANLFIDGSDLVWDLQEAFDVPEPLALVVRTGQGVMIADRAERFYRKVEFDIDQVAFRIRPAGPTSPVVIDPTQRFGRPTVNGVSTERLWELHDAGESVDEISNAYDMTDEHVRAAVAYYEQFRSLAA